MYFLFVELFPLQKEITVLKIILNYTTEKKLDYFTYVNKSFLDPREV